MPLDEETWNRLAENKIIGLMHILQLPCSWEYASRGQVMISFPVKKAVPLAIHGILRNTSGSPFSPALALLGIPITRVDSPSEFCFTVDPKVASPNPDR